MYVAGNIFFDSRRCFTNLVYYISEGFVSNIHANIHHSVMKMINLSTNVVYLSLGGYAQRELIVVHSFVCLSVCLSRQRKSEFEQ